MSLPGAMVMNLPGATVMSFPGEDVDTGGREGDEEVTATPTIGVAMIQKSVSLKVNSEAGVKVCSFCFFNKTRIYVLVLPYLRITSKC